MGYALHIELEDSAIELEQWISVIDAIEGARINSVGTKAVNLAKGEEISISANPGDVEVEFTTSKFFGLKKQSRWEFCIWFNSGRVSFNATDDIDSPANPVHRVASQAARLLSAKIIGDEGEVYAW
ncbi:hypothetical protein EZV61_19355 [Corallincola luteus]|uniref:PH domain-containing protein n=1 Tax=Corallincola luteus TaxID=1775177 RepID=A0ABY2AG93_9GAMM|nr:hypothetical protein [Corallincola luteus]TCI01062.1 hypothetical protein EZV61_19355 [Corallincola luteus]